MSTTGKNPAGLSAQMGAPMLRIQRMTNERISDAIIALQDRITKAGVKLKTKSACVVSCCESPKDSDWPEKRLGSRCTLQSQMYLLPQSISYTIETARSRPTTGEKRRKTDLWIYRRHYVIRCHEKECGWVLILRASK